MEKTLKNKVLTGVLGGVMGLVGIVGCQEKEVFLEFKENLDNGHRSVTYTRPNGKVATINIRPGDCFTINGDHKQQYFTIDQNCDGQADFTYLIHPEVGKILR